MMTCFTGARRLVVPTREFGEILSSPVLKTISYEPYCRLYRPAKLWPVAYGMRKPGINDSAVDGWPLGNVRLQGREPGASDEQRRLVPTQVGSHPIHHGSLEDRVVRLLGRVQDACDSRPPGPQILRTGFCLGYPWELKAGCTYYLPGLRGFLWGLELCGPSALM
eukprot:1189181-Prorocentrum_minimum.AAC.8